MSSPMADSEHSYGKTHTPRELHSSVGPKGTKSVGQVKSLTQFFCKFLFIALFLVAIPLFPSQAPDFINQTVLTKFWELVHLLFIGVAVSYGLFCRRNVDMDIETQTNSNTDDSQSYVSRILQVSSIFEDGYDNSYGYGDKNVYQTWYTENYKGESIIGVTNGSSEISDQSRARSLNCEVGFEISSGYGENNVNQAWNSQYFQGDSMVVVNQPNCAVNEYSESGLITGHKPLGLPIRSLRLRVRNQESPEISNGSETSSIPTDSSKSPTESVDKTFGDMGPLNLENRFNETAALSSPIPRRSISGTMEMRENVDIASRPSHLRPHSVDETQFEALKSQSFWPNEFFSSQTSSLSDSPTRLSPSHTVSSELENSKMEELGKEKTFRSSYPPTSLPTNGKPSLNAFHIRRYTSGSLFEKNAQKSSGDELKHMRGSESRREDQLGSKEWRSSALKSDGNPANLVKASSRGKSVRTIRARRYAAEAMKTGEKSGNHVNNNAGKASDEIEALHKGKSEMKNGGFDNLLADVRKEDLNNHNPMLKPTHSGLQKRKNKEASEDFAVEPKEKSWAEAENFQVNSDEESVADSVNDAGPDPNEVDKKAGEFIAKFREQIRLQKMASIDNKSRERKHFR